MRKQRIEVRSLLAVLLLFVPTLVAAHEGHEGGDLEPMSIQSVVAGGAAEAAGVEVGDRLVAMAGRQITTMGDLEQVMGTHTPGDTVPLTVVRDGAPINLTLTFGERDGGRVALGVSLAVMGAAPAAAPTASAGDRLGREECHTWIDDTYQLESMARQLGLDLGDSVADLRSCVDGDLQRMTLPIPFGWCDNVFKVHCSALDVLTEIGEALIARCEAQLGESLGIDLSRDRVWTTCAADRVYDRYSRNGQASDEAACRAAYQECSSGQ